ncbi:MAG: hypothetical protein HY706_04205 [Candidatus Hydrogenedentes bacterium]|nr:hypothetical protein [Candidatus Hydrogenedentota bacterium]
MSRISCPYLEIEVELTAERETHIAERHPDLLPQYRYVIAETLAEPDQVRRSQRLENAKLFSRWYNDLRGGKHVVVVVVSGEFRGTKRHWIVTAYMARKLAEGVVEWSRS